MAANPTSSCVISVGRECFQGRHGCMHVCVFADGSCTFLTAAQVLAVMASDVPGVRWGLNVGLRESLRTHLESHRGSRVMGLTLTRALSAAPAAASTVALTTSALLGGNDAAGTTGAGHVDLENPAREEEDLAVVVQQGATIF